MSIKKTAIFVVCRQLGYDTSLSKEFYEPETMVKTKRMVYIILAFVGISIICVCVFLQQPKFGKLPSGERLERIKQSPNYKNGAFQNLQPTPTLTNGANYPKIIWELQTNKNQHIQPDNCIPALKTDLQSFDSNNNVFVWFGHSSYFMQINGKKLLIDPVLSGSASPLSFTTKAFKGTSPYTVDDIPNIDYLFITHDHWDHLDYTTIIKLKPQIDSIICPLGVGEHFEHWGFDKKKIIELDWFENVHLNADLTVHTVPSRHFSGRAFKRNCTLWASYVLQTPTLKIFMGCDGGYNNYFTDIAKQFDYFDIAILENGQYHKYWANIHTKPEETAQIAIDLRAKRVIPIHSGKFALAMHDWDEPLKRLSELSVNLNFRLLTPKIGEQMNLNDTTQVFTKWWEDVN